MAKKKTIRRKKHSTSPRHISVTVMRGNVLGCDVYRGLARLCDLSRMSQADIYDQITNPTGTQRDLSPKHARAAYEYVKTHDLAFWPEVFLCLRNPSVATYIESDGNKGIGVLRIDMDAIQLHKGIAISRVDGNHRLHFAGGTYEGFPPLEQEVSFCLAYNLKRDEEITLFRDINDNQRRMNTSHLDNIQARLTPEARLKREDPTLYIAEKLGEDEDSPFHGRVYEGGKKPPECFMPLRNLKTGLRYMLSQPSKLTELRDVDAQYKVIRNYFAAVKKWQPAAWESPRQYILLRGAGFWGVCFLGAAVIDKALTQGVYSSDALYRVLKTGADFDWSNKGDFMGFSGRGGAVKIRDLVVQSLADPSGVSVSALARKIIEEK